MKERTGNRSDKGLQEIFEEVFDFNAQNSTSSAMLLNQLETSLVSN